MENIFLVDASYFGHRALHGERISNKNFTLETEAQRKTFVGLLNGHFVSLIDSLKANQNSDNMMMRNIVFTFDDDSWRKSETAFIPYYMDETSKEWGAFTYKENRKKIKEKTDIDYDAFNSIIDNWESTIAKFIPTFRLKNGESDDALFLLKEKLKKDFFVWIFATDGDLETLVDEKTSLFKNTKSKIYPNSPIIISKYNHNKFYGPQDILAQMAGNNLERNGFRRICNTTFTHLTASTANRESTKEIVIAKPNLTLLKKVILGDEKDNLFPMFRWKTKTGNSTRKLSETNLMDTISKLENVNSDDESIGQLLKDKQKLGNLLTMLRNDYCDNKEKCTVSDVARHYKHNLKMNSLSFEYIPQRIVDEFNQIFEKEKSRIYSILDISAAQRLNTNRMDDAAVLINNAIPKPSESNETYKEILLDSPTTPQSILDILGN